MNKFCFETFIPSTRRFLNLPQEILPDVEEQSHHHQKFFLMSNLNPSGYKSKPSSLLIFPGQIENICIQVTHLLVSQIFIILN